jgi:integrase
VICKDRLHSLREYLLNKYADLYARRKVINFSKAFLKYLAQTRFDGRYEAFTLFLTMPKPFKERKHITSRIVTKKDIENVLSAIEDARQNEQIDDCHYQNYRAMVLFGAFTGQRPQSTTARLTVGQSRAAVSQKKPVIDVLPEQDKIRMQHYCPLHPQLVDALLPLQRGRRDDEPMFNQLSFERWLKQRKVPLLHSGHHFVSGDLRKFCELMGGHPTVGSVK